MAGGNTVIAAQTSSDGLRFYRNQYGTNTWCDEQLVTSGTAHCAPSLAQDGNGVVAPSYFGEPTDCIDYNGSGTWEVQGCRTSRNPTRP